MQNETLTQKLKTNNNKFPSEASFFFFQFNTFCPIKNEISHLFRRFYNLTGTSINELFYTQQWHLCLKQQLSFLHQQGHT